MYKFIILHKHIQNRNSDDTHLYKLFINELENRQMYDNIIPPVVGGWNTPTISLRGV